MSKPHKTCITNPELVKVGQRCKVRMSTAWMEMDSDEPYVYLSARIIDVSYKSVPKIPCVTVRVYRCARRGNYWTVDRLMVLPSEIARINDDGTVEDYETIIFK